MKILVVRFSSIGDIVLTTPVVRCIKKQLKDAEVHYLTKNNFISLLENNPYIDKIIGIEKHIREVKDQLLSENYDFIVDLHNNLRTFQVKALLRKPSGSFPKLNIEKWMLVNLKRNVMPNIHVVDRYFKAAASLGVKNDNEGLDYFIPDNEPTILKSLPEHFRTGYTAIVIGAKFNTKKYPAEKVREVCKLLNSPVVLVGGPEDREEGVRISESLPNVFNGCGKFSFNGSAQVLKEADVVIANDTGFMHIAAALKKPVVSIWGNTVPSFGMYPYLPKEKSRIVERLEVPCRPCSKLGYSKCPRGHFNCMNLIKPEDVINAARDLMNG